MKTIKDLKLRLKTPKQRKVLERLVLHPSRLEGYKHLARLLAREGDTEGAEKVLRLALTYFPKDRLTREQLAGLYEDMGRTARAAEIYRKLIKEGESWPAYLRLSRIHQKKGDYEGAVAILKSIPSRHPFKERSYIPLYDLLFAMGAHKRGIQNIKAAIRHCGPSHQLVKKLGRLYMKDGQKVEGIKFLKKALRYKPDDLDAVKLIGLANLDLGRYGLARNWFFKILEQDRDSYQAHIELAELALRQDKLDEAKKWVDQILRVQKKKREPWDSRSKLALAEYYLRKGNHKKAVELAVDGLSETPFYYPMELVHAHAILAEGYRALDDEFKAEVHSRIEKALIADSDAFNAFIDLAHQLEKEKKLAEAKEVLEQLLITFPGNILTLLNLAEAQFRRGMTRSAVQLARAAAEGSEGSFIQDKIKALKLLVRVSRASGLEGAARDYERRVKKLLSGGRA
ncbi:MAG: tetratricopeptide repeat protein [Candidatus Euphemobacter frigidus]|nr:tetratricopeptide repeat protein [Candidatus Euphemobacter frigidus]MDP8276720.1 tetratricopeptide repeat protein [Candidatus Euphemobacter frigidus]